VGPIAYLAVGPFFTDSGQWDVSVDVRRAEADDVTADFPVAVAGPGEKDDYAYPLTAGGWLTVAAVAVLLAALFVAIWADRLPEPPQPFPRLVRVGTAAVTVIAVGLVALSFLPGDSTAESIAIGRTLYQNNCRQCHGDDGRGDGPLAGTLPVPPADFRVHVPYHKDEFFFLVISNGLGSIMPSFQSQLTEDERWHLVNFLKSEFGTDDQPTPTTSP
jgi:mono/diheme cytochrome c family protein